MKRKIGISVLTMLATGSFWVIVFGVQHDCPNASLMQVLGFPVAMVVVSFIICWLYVWSLKALGGD